jgi:hypothetical protein
MKKIFSAVLLLALNFAGFGQSAPKCDSVSLKTAGDVKNSEPCVLKAAEYVLGQPVQGSTDLTKKYNAFILVWMEKADYTFSLNDKMTALFKDENLFLFGTYMACLSKAAIELKKDFDTEAVKLLVEYINNPANKVKQTSKIKQLVKDYNDKKIEKYIK